MKIKDYKCKCGHDDFFFAHKWLHKGIYCTHCEKWFKWADEDEQDLTLEQEPKPMMRTEEVKRAINYLLGIWGDYGRHKRAVEVLIAYIENLENEVLQLQSVTKNPIECDDVVSRQSVFECATLITSIPTEDWDIGDWVCLFRDRVSQLPSIRPQVQTGEWNLLDECANSGYYCSICQKKLVKEGWSKTVKKIKYCPNCGARMVEPRERSEQE